MTHRQRDAWPQTIVVGLLVAMATCFATNARAQYAVTNEEILRVTRTDEPSNTVDQAALAMGVIGVMAVAGGIVGLASAPATQDDCTPVTPASGFGCGGNDDFEARGPSLAMLTGGATALAFSGGLLLVNRGSRQRHVTANDSLLGSGIVMSGMGLSGLIGATASWTYAVVEDDGSDLGAPVGALMALVSAGIVAGGVPMWLRGAKPVNYRDGGPPVRYGEPSVRRSPSMWFGGVVFTIAGVAVIGTGIATAAIAGQRNGGAGILMVPNLLVGGTLIGTGIPLWIKGAATVHPESVYAFAPAVRIGPRRVQLGWRF
jgi:hypothetical protein